ncbi:hypothetical protein ACFO1V_03210 [Daeguia caeni]|uniref:DUF4376 domain-containing protein n=1 Tax=Daeguia caeni TaxID=439612 RepID=A0ABV9H4H6_9HYPH
MIEKVYRATFTTDGIPTGFYPSDVWPTGYPENAVEITEDQYTELLEYQGMRRYIDGEVVAYAPPPPPITPDDVDAERDRRIAGGFIFGGVFYQTRPEDLENIAGASTAALAAIMNGAAPGDYRWHGSDTDFVWIAADNSTHAMDAQTLFAFGQAAMAHKQAHIFAARALKDQDPIPADYTDDKYWPIAEEPEAE